MTFGRRRLGQDRERVPCGFGTDEGAPFRPIAWAQDQPIRHAAIAREYGEGPREVAQVQPDAA